MKKIIMNLLAMVWFISTVAWVVVTASAISSNFRMRETNEIVRDNVQIFITARKQLILDEQVRNEIAEVCKYSDDAGIVLKNVRNVLRERDIAWRIINVFVNKETSGGTFVQYRCSYPAVISMVVLFFVMIASMIGTVVLKESKK